MTKLTTTPLKTLLSTAGLALALSLATALPASAAGNWNATSGTAALPAYQAAQDLIKQEKYAEAIDALKAMNMPQDADVLNLLGHASRMLGHVDEGIAYYLAALKIDPKHIGVHEYLGEAYLMKADLPDAQKMLTELTTLCGSSGCAEIKQLSDAIDAYKKKQGS